MIQKMSEKDYLIASAIELFTNHSIEDVSVKDICANCGISRRTYYNYFKDKNDIITQCFVTITNRYYNEHREELTMHSLLLYMAEEVCSNSSFFRHAFSYKGQNNIRLSLVSPMQSMLEKLYLNTHHEAPDQSIKDALSFFIYGMLSYVEKEIASQNIPDAQKSTAFFENALPLVLKEAYY